MQKKLWLYLLPVLLGGSVSVYADRWSRSQSQTREAPSQSLDHAMPRREEKFIAPAPHVVEEEHLSIEERVKRDIARIMQQALAKSPGGDQLELVEDAEGHLMPQRRANAPVKPVRYSKQERSQAKTKAVKSESLERGIGRRRGRVAALRRETEAAEKQRDELLAAVRRDEEEYKRREEHRRMFLEETAQREAALQDESDEYLQRGRALLERMQRERMQRAEHDEQERAATQLQNVWRNYRSVHPYGLRHERDEAAALAALKPFKDKPGEELDAFVESTVTDRVMKEREQRREAAVAASYGERTRVRPEEPVEDDSFEGKNRFVGHAALPSQEWETYGSGHELQKKVKPSVRERKLHKSLTGYGRKNLASQKKNARREQLKQKRQDSLQPVLVEDGPLVTAQKPAPADPWHRDHETALVPYVPADSPAVVAPVAEPVAEPTTSVVVVPKEQVAEEPTEPSSPVADDDGTDDDTTEHPPGGSPGPTAAAAKNDTPTDDAPATSAAPAALEAQPTAKGAGMNKGTLALVAFFASLSAGALYKMKNWSKQYDGLSNDQLDDLKIGSAKRVMLKLARRGRQLFGASFGKKPGSAKEAAAPAKLTSSGKGKKLDPGSSPGRQGGEGLMTRMKKSGWNPWRWFKRKPALS